MNRASTQLRVCLIFLLALSSYSRCLADLTVHPLFTDHGVLQQKVPTPVWGTADPESKVVVRFAGQQKETTTGNAGRWMVTLDPLTATSQPGELVVSSGSDSLSVADLLVGEVWVCSGQSNMAMATRSSSDFDKLPAEIAAGSMKTLRLFKVPVAGADDRQATVKAKWTPVNETTAGAFSAVGFYFGRALHRDRKVPVALIQAANGGTNAYSWINSDTVNKDPVAESVRDYWAAALRVAPERLASYEKKKAEWQQKLKAARAAKQPFNERAPREPMHAQHVKRPAGHYNAMVAPLQPYAIRGAIWYQGEANSRPPFCSQYQDLMFALVEDWRSDWAAAAGGNRTDFPFYLVQLPNYANGHPQGWPVIREQMLRFWQRGKNTGMVTTIDVGDPRDIHPKNKMPVGERLARFARGNTYGEQIVYSGPVFESIAVNGNKIAVDFKHVGSALKSLDGESLRHFQVAGANRKFVDATAVIDADRLIVSSPQVSEPKAVRYAWTNNPEHPNFVNEEGLVATPFRSDEWKIDYE